MTDEEEIGQAGGEAEYANETDETAERPGEGDEPSLNEQRNEEASTHGSP